MTSPSAAAQPVLRAPPNVNDSAGMSSTRAPRARAMSGVPSVEPRRSGAVAGALAQQCAQRVPVRMDRPRRVAVLEAPAGVLDAEAQVGIPSRADVLGEAADRHERLASHGAVGGLGVAD